VFQYIRMISVLYWKLRFGNGAQHFSHLLSFKNGYSGSKLTVKTHLLFGILMIFYS
jgi:hypothetical protein